MHYVNHTYQRTGTLWEGRYKASLVDSEAYLLTCMRFYQSLGDTPTARQYAYRELFRSHLEPEHIHQIRETLNQELVLGRDDFKDKIEKMTQRQAKPKPQGSPGVEESSSIYYVM